MSARPGLMLTSAVLGEDEWCSLAFASFQLGPPRSFVDRERAGCYPTDSVLLGERCADVDRGEQREDVCLQNLISASRKVIAMAKARDDRNRP